MTLNITTYLSITPNVSIKLNEETHVYTLNVSGNTYESDTSVTSVINPNGNNSSFNDARMKSAAAIGTEKHLLLENTLNKFIIMQHTEGVQYDEFCSMYREEEDCDQVVLAFLEQLLNLFKRYNVLMEHVHLYPEVKLFSIITNEHGQSINVGGSIDVLVILPNKEFWILDLKTAISQSTKQANKTKYTNQICMYSHLISARGTFNIIKAAYIYSDEHKYSFDGIFIAEKLEATNPFEHLKDLYAIAIDKKFNIETTVRKSENQNLITKIKMLFEEKNKLKTKLKEIDCELDALLEEDTKDLQLGSVYYDNIKYMRYSIYKTTYDMNLIKDKCPEAIVKKRIMCNKISMLDNCEDENDK